MRIPLIRVPANRKLRVGIFSFTGDEGCVITLLEVLNYKFFEWKDKIDIVYARTLRSKNDLTNLDVAFVEGAISTPSEEAKLREIRANAKNVVAIGTCAINGLPSAQRNNFPELLKREIEPLVRKLGQFERMKAPTEIIKVEDQVPGCPMLENKFVEVLEKYIKQLEVG